MNILAIDPATQCGWAVDKFVFGVWDLKPKRDESKGMRLIRLRSKLQEIHDTQKLDIIVFERPGGRYKAAIITQSEIQGVIKMFCEDNGIEYRAYSSSEIKKHATGKGNAGKPLMIKSAWEKLDYMGNDDNEADALWLLDLAKTDLNLK